MSFGMCEWRDDFGGRCRLAISSAAPSALPSIVPTELHSLNRDPRRLQSFDRSRSCDMRFQRADLTAYATFSLGNASTSIIVDVTDHASFASSNMTVAAVDASHASGPKLQGIAPGTVEVSVVLFDFNHSAVSLEDAVSLVEVTSDAPAVVQGLTVVVYTGMEWTDSVGSVALEGEGSAGITLKHELTAEGDTASVAIYADFDDGTYEDVTGEAGLVSHRPHYLMAQWRIQLAFTNTCRSSRANQMLQTSRRHHRGPPIIEAL